MTPSRRAAHRGLTVLFTGLSGAGKTTTATALVEFLRASGRSVTLIDGDAVRQRLAPALGFTRADRVAHIKRVAGMAAEISARGEIAICAVIAPYVAMRSEMRATVEAVGGFMLVHMATPLAICERRDPKGLYARARAGELANFTGISDPYEEPTDADLRLDASIGTPDEGAAQVMAWLAAHRLIDAAVAGA